MATRSDRRRKTADKPPMENAELYHQAVRFLVIGFGLLHRWHVSTLFENDRHFSHLSEIEREMSFRTEMGMYYSYYKTIVESNSWKEGLDKLTFDNLSEYGNVVNVGRKYNLFPEITIGTLYRGAKVLGLVSSPQCWQIERGDGLSSVTSCEGISVPVYFYLEFVWLAAMCTAGVLFRYSTYLNGSVFSGFITILHFFFNHNECTRVQWTPPLRESFAYPMLLYQMYLVSMALKKYAQPGTQKRITWKEATSGLFADIICMITMSLASWQFSHFVFATQITALLILKWFKVISSDLYKTFCIVHVLGCIAVTFITNGSLLFCSVYMCLLIGSNLSDFLLSKISRYVTGNVRILTEITVTIILTKWLKSYVLTSEDDSHVYDLLKAKLTDYKDFHTMLYTCSAEFDFLQYKTYEIITKTLLLPSAVLAGILALYCWYRNYKTAGYPACIEPDMAYNGLQTGAFIIMAVFIMRLKLFMNPHLCIIAGAVCSKKYLEKLGVKNDLTRGAILVLLIAGMSCHGVERFYEERGFIGEYSNIEQEELFEWIKSNTPEHAVFAGKMSLMANLMLSTRRPIVNNPYYESKEMRDRTMKVYEIFSRKDAASVYVTLRNMHVGYVVLEEPSCLGYANLQPGCQMLDLWDLVDNGSAKAAGKQPLCPLLFQGHAYPFRRAFMNDHYVVLQLDYSHYVELKPKISVPLHYQS